MNDAKVCGLSPYIWWGINLTKASDLIQKHFPRCVVVHGVVHVCLHIFEEIFKLLPCRKMKINGNMVSPAVLLLALWHLSHKLCITCWAITLIEITVCFLRKKVFKCELIHAIPFLWSHTKVPYDITFCKAQIFFLFVQKNPLKCMLTSATGSRWA